MDEPKRPYYLPEPQRKQNAVLRAVAELVKQLGEVAPKIDHQCKIVEKDKYP